MKRSLAALVPLLPLLTACPNDDGDEDDVNDEGESGSESSSSDSDSSSSSDSDSSRESESESSESESSESESSESESSESESSESESSESESSESESTETETETETEGETGVEEPPPGYCGMSAGPADAWFEIVHEGMQLDSGDPFAPYCNVDGGVFLFTFEVDLGGFIPEKKVVDFHLTMDVPGFNVGPNGHFAEKDFEVFIGCCPQDYEAYPIFCLYDPEPFILVPLSLNTSIDQLDGLVATLQLTMFTPDEGPVDRTLDVELWIEPEPNWYYCGFGE